MTTLVRIWHEAADAAHRTPVTRNRYADALRALSILAVVVGHWLIAAPHILDGRLAAVNLLAEAPWTQYLTWVFQVMPIFFVVGGYSNAASLQAARRDGVTYSTWLQMRARRLALPAVPLVVAWAVTALALNLLGLEESLIGV